MIYKFNKQALSYFDLVNDKRTLFVSNNFIESLFCLIDFFEIKEKFLLREPSNESALLHGRIAQTNGKYYSLAQVSTWDKDKLERIRQVVQMVLKEAEFTSDIVKPQAKTQFQRKLKIDTNVFSTTLNLLSKSQFLKGTGTQDEIQILFELMQLEKTELRNSPKWRVPSKSNLIFNCNTGDSLNRDGESLIEIASIQPMNSTNQLLKVPTNALEYINNNSSKAEIEEFLAMLETDQLKLYAHEYLFHIQTRGYSTKKKRSNNTDDTPLEPIHYKGTTAYIFPIL